MTGSARLDSLLIAPCQEALQAILLLAYLEGYFDSQRVYPVCLSCFDLFFFFSLFMYWISCYDILAADMNISLDCGSHVALVAKHCNCAENDYQIYLWSL